MFNSNAILISSVNLPTFNGKVGDQLYMLPFTFQDFKNIPEKWKNWLKKIENKFPKFTNDAYLTVDQKLIKAGKRHRRGGLHIDGNYIDNDWGSSGGWLNGVSGINISPENHKHMYLEEGLGTLIISDYPACEVWQGKFKGTPSHGGNCEHLRNQLSDKSSFVMSENLLYWMGSQCVHESLPIEKTVKRTLVRITLPIY